MELMGMKRTQLENNWFGHRAAAPRLKELLNELADLDELDGNINEVLDTFEVHFKAAAAMDTEVASQLDTLIKARTGLKRAGEVAEAIKGVLEQYPEDKTAGRAARDAEVMIKRFQRNEKQAAKMVRTLSKKQMPKALADAAGKTTRVLRKLLADPKSMHVLPWQDMVTNYRTGTKGVRYLVVLRTLTEQGDVDITLALSSINTEGVIILQGHRSEGWDIKTAKAMFLEAMGGRLELKGEGRQISKRLQIAPDIAQEMGWYANSMGDTYNREPEISKDGRIIEMSFRTQFDERDYGQYEDVETPDYKPGMVKELSEYKSVIKDIDVGYGEKGWFYITVKLK